MIESTYSFAFTIVRRSLFFLALTFNGAISVSLVQYGLRSGAGLTPEVVLAWGMNAIGEVLAIWLVTRKDIWRSWSGLTRIAIYIVASAYGRMLFSATQDSWTYSDKGFTWPGGTLHDYHWAVFDVLIVMMFALLLKPIVSLMGIMLADSEEANKPVARLSISGIMLYMTAIGFLVFWIKLLASDEWAQNRVGGLTQSATFKLWLGEYLPFTIPPVAAATVMLIGLMKRWWIAIIFIVAATALDMICTGIVGSIAEQLTGERQGGIVGGSTPDRWYYICGRSITVAMALSTARLLSVRPISASPKVHSSAADPTASNAGPDWSI